MTDNQDNSVHIPRTLKEAKQLLRKIVKVRREIARLELRRDTRKGNIDATYDEKLGPLWEEYARLVEPFFTYVIASRKSIFALQSVMHLVHGVLKRTGGRPLLIEDEEKTIATLKLLGHNDLIIVKESVSRNALALRSELVEQLPGVKFGATTKFKLSIDPSPLGGTKPLTDERTISED